MMAHHVTYLCAPYFPLLLLCKAQFTILALSRHTYLVTPPFTTQQQQHQSSFECKEIKFSHSLPLSFRTHGCNKIYHAFVYLNLCLSTLLLADAEERDFCDNKKFFCDFFSSIAFILLKCFSYYGE